jgi:hypothetical protein
MDNTTNGQVRAVPCWTCGQPLPAHTPPQRAWCDAAVIADEVVIIHAHPAVWEARTVARVLAVLRQLRAG